MDNIVEPQLSKKDLVIGIASSALFDLAESDEIYNKDGVKAYADYQNQHLTEPFKKGPAFPFISRLLDFNKLFADSENQGVEVIVLSRNSPQTGLRVMKSIEHYRLGITRSIFRSGKASYDFMKVLNMSLFLSGNPTDVQNAMQEGNAAGYVLPRKNSTKNNNGELCIAFDFDGVLAGSSSDDFYTNSKKKNPQKAMELYQRREKKLVNKPLEKGPLAPLLVGLNKLQQAARKQKNKGIDLRISLVTARNGFANERAIHTLESWGLTVDDAFFLGGLDKAPILNQLKPDIFFDNEMKNLDNTESHIPMVFIPFGKEAEQLELSDIK